LSTIIFDVFSLISRHLSSFSLLSESSREAASSSLLRQKLEKRTSLLETEGRHLGRENAKTGTRI